MSEARMYRKTQHVMGLSRSLSGIFSKMDAGSDHLLYGVNAG
jgi:hypothetical protein